MRDPERIAPFLNKLGELWRCYPDWRFGQLVWNLLGGASDTFFIEDPITLLWIQEEIDAYTAHLRGVQETSGPQGEPPDTQAG